MKQCEPHSVPLAPKGPYALHCTVHIYKSDILNLRPIIYEYWYNRIQGYCAKRRFWINNISPSPEGTKPQFEKPSEKCAACEQGLLTCWLKQPKFERGLTHLGSALLHP